MGVTFWSLFETFSEDISKAQSRIFFLQILTFLGPVWGPLGDNFGTFGRLLGGSVFDKILEQKVILKWEGPAAEGGLLGTCKILQGACIGIPARPAPRQAGCGGLVMCGALPPTLKAYGM